jgi:mono/diheme cytochrome c family protein
MYFSKKQTKRSVPLVRAMALTAAVAVMALISGCAGQSTKIVETNTNKSLLSEPVVDQTLVEQDFAFPSQRPSLMRGREMFQAQCSKCHAPAFWQGDKVKHDMAYTTPIDTYLMLTTGHAPAVEMPNAQRRQVLPANHPAFRDPLSRDDRWAVIFYTRYLAGAGDIQSPDPKTDVAAIFGGNCAVCHGTKGQADGPLYTAKTGNHELHDGTQVKNLMPAPANFRQFNRLYNRTDAQLLKYVCEGIYPSAMPAWYGNVNVDKDSGKVTYAFDEKLITNLVRHVRSLAYENDLPLELPEVKTIPAGLPVIDACKPVATNRPWTNAMRDNGPNKGHNYVLPPANPITGGMVHVGDAPAVPVIHANKGTGANPSSTEERKAQ